jgi:hypothetical protein
MKNVGKRPTFFNRIFLRYDDYLGTIIHLKQRLSQNLKVAHYQ